MAHSLINWVGSQTACLHIQERQRKEQPRQLPGASCWPASMQTERKGDWESQMCQLRKDNTELLLADLIQPSRARRMLSYFVAHCNMACLIWSFWFTSLADFNWDTTRLRLLIPGKNWPDKTRALKQGWVTSGPRAETSRSPCLVLRSHPEGHPSLPLLQSLLECFF